MTVTLHHGNCLDILPTLPDCSIDSIVTDPPYELGFMGKKWDASGIAYNITLWQECLRVLKPGGHLLAFGGTRTYHRMACAIEDAGFEIRDSIHWLYGSGFPKSLDVSKSIDKMAGHWRGKAGEKTSDNGSMSGPNYERTDKGEPITAAAAAAAGWGTALKPAHEPVVVARKPLSGTVAANILEWGTGAINIDATRVAGEKGWPDSKQYSSGISWGDNKNNSFTQDNSTNPSKTLGRWPANVILDDTIANSHDDWPRYFYCAKPSRRERNTGLDQHSTHPTVKPLALMRYLVRLVTPPNGTVLEPFAGSGTTLMAAILEGFDAIGIEMTDEYLPIIRGRVAWAEQEATKQQEELEL